jgi:hypothetical protein
VSYRFLGAVRTRPELLVSACARCVHAVGNLLRNRVHTPARPVPGLLAWLARRAAPPVAARRPNSPR